MERDSRPKPRARRGQKYPFGASRRVHSPFFSFLVSRRDAQKTKVLVVVSKKTAKRAFVRNRLRRRVKEWFRTRPGIMRELPDIAVIVKPEASRLTRKQFYEELEKGTQSFIR